MKITRLHKMKMGILGRGLPIVSIILLMAEPDRSEAQSYSLIRLGFYGPGYSNYETSYLAGFDAGHAVGVSQTDSYGYAVWQADLATGTTSRIGLFGAGYTLPGGYQDSYVSSISGKYAFGRSTRFDSVTSDYLGYAAWVTDVSTGDTTRVGLFDSAHTQSGGYQESAITGGFSTGYVIGYSDAYAGSTMVRRSAWVGHAGTEGAIGVGLYGTGFGTTANFQYNSVQDLAGGYAVGLAKIDPPNISSYPSMNAVWAANVSTGVTSRIGLYGAGYTNSNGTQTSALASFDGVYAVVSSSKYKGTDYDYYGEALSVTNVTTGTINRIGLYGSLHTAANGYQYSQGAYYISGGYTAGTSEKYGPTEFGQDAWVADLSSGATARVGFYGSDYIRSDGYQSSYVRGFAGGYVSGGSSKFSGMTSLGQAAWLALPSNPGAPSRIGFFDSAYTRSDGYQFSTVNNTAGIYHGGYSERFTYSSLYGDISLGQDAWVVNAATGTATMVGLVDSDHTRTTGYQSGYRYSSIERMAGTYVSGYSQKMAGEYNYLGLTSWVFNLQTQELDAISLSLRDDGVESSYISQLYDTGLAIGYYTLYDGMTDLGDRAFAYTPEDGAFDLASAVVGGISATGWTKLMQAYQADPLTGAIIGAGGVPSSIYARGVYLAIPTPEPGSATLLLCGATLLATRRRARTAR